MCDIHIFYLSNDFSTENEVLIRQTSAIKLYHVGRNAVKSRWRLVLSVSTIGKYLHMCLPILTLFFKTCSKFYVLWVNFPSLSTSYSMCIPFSYRSTVSWMRMKCILLLKYFFRAVIGGNSYRKNYERINRGFN